MAKSKNVKKAFDRFFKYPNPIFCVPVSYFKVGNYLCEIAVTKTIRDMRWDNCNFALRNPLLILEGLFVDSGCYVTVLERLRTGYKHRTDLCTHMEDWRKEINPFIWKLKDN